MHTRAPSLTPAPALFRATQRLAVLDEFRVPYEIAAGPSVPGVQQLRPHGGARALLWPSSPPERVVAATLAGGERDEATPVFAGVLADELAEPLLSELGTGWKTARAVLGADGRRLGSIWRDASGSVFLPFHPDEVVTSYWSERYGSAATGSASRAARRTLMRGYYGVRPALPRPVQIALRRRFSRLQARSRFPRWPVETALHDFYDLLLALLAEIASQPVPCIAPWPDGHSWALVLTHDVETAAGCAAIGRVLDVERVHGLRSSWNFVPGGYDVDPALLRQLTETGFEVGVHGLYHDGRDLESLATLRKRLPAIRDAAERWGAVGFRSPATHRHWDWMPLLGFDYDTSSPDTDPFEPQAGGCCSWLPFFNRELVKLPLTMPQDHTLFVILGHRDESAWLQKASFLRDRGGMALLDTHPDYLVDDRVLGAYARFLGRFAGDRDAWKALPREVSAWWRRRAASRLERTGQTWRVVGPAVGEARIEFAEERP